MRAIVIDGCGGVDRLRSADMLAPVPAADEIGIAVAAAAVNPADLRVIVAVRAEHRGRAPGLRAAESVLNGLLLARIAGLVASGVIAVPLDRTLPLDRATKAHRLAAAGGFAGKIVLQP